MIAWVWRLVRAPEVFLPCGFRAVP